MGECDHVFFACPNFATGIGLTIHVHTKIRQNYSFVERAVLKIGDEVLEIGSFGDYMLNGVNNAEMPNIMSDLPINHTLVSAKEHVFSVSVSDGTSINVKVYKDIVSIKFDFGSETISHF